MFLDFVNRREHAFDSLPVALANLLGNGIELTPAHLVRDALLTLVQGLADAGNDLEAASKRGLDLVGDDLVRVTEQRSALRVTEDDPRDAGVLDLLRGNLSRESTRVDEVAVLGSNLDRSVDVAVDVEEVDRRRSNDNLCTPESVRR